MSGSDIIPPILPVHAVEDMFLEWQSPEAKAGFDMLWRMRQHIVEQCVLSYAPRAWERLSKADEANRARALAVSIDNACRGIDREIALYLANYSHPAMLFVPADQVAPGVWAKPDGGHVGAAHALDATLYVRAMSRAKTVAEATAERLAPEGGGNEDRG
jgi:hypothetical protein